MVDDPLRPWWTKESELLGLMDAMFSEAEGPGIMLEPDPTEPDLL